MKTKQKKQNTSKFVSFVVSIVLFLFAIAVALYTPLNQTPQYDELNQAQSTVKSFHVNHHRKTVDDAILRTTDGKKYYIRGSYNKSELYEQLKKGVHVQIKYYERKAFFVERILCAEELVVSGENLCTYNNYDAGNTVGCIIASCIFMVTSALLFWQSRKKK